VCGVAAALFLALACYLLLICCCNALAVAGVGDLGCVCFCHEIRLLQATPPVCAGDTATLVAVVL
jgi:hypothetical protein